MSRIYGHRWTSTYDADPAEGAGREWAIGLADLTIVQIGAAVDACRRGLATSDGWPPTLPEFRALALGIPAFDAIRAELLSRDSSQRSPFAIAVGRHLDLWAWRRADADRADRMLRAAYERVRDSVMAGEPLPEPALEIAAPVEAPRISTPEVGCAALASVAAMLGGAT